MLWHQVCALGARAYITWIMDQYTVPDPDCSSNLFRDEGTSGDATVSNAGSTTGVQKKPKSVSVNNNLLSQGVMRVGAFGHIKANWNTFSYHRILYV